MIGSKMILALGVALSLPAGLRAQETKAIVTNGTSAVEVIRVEKQDTLAGVFVPQSPDAAFLVVYLETEDPTFDPTRVSLADMAEACGTVEAEELGIVAADGGGLVDGALVCSYVVPRDTAGTVTLRLVGYPELELTVE